MDALAALTQARSEFEIRLRQIGDDQWNAATPCSEWDVRQLVNHMMLGNRMTVQLLGGAGAQDVMAGFGDDLVGGTDDPVSAFVALADELYAGFAAEGGLDGTVNHPMGEIPRSMFVGFRIGDYGTHAWDLARAIGADEKLDDDLVGRMWHDMQPMAAGLAATGMFGSGPSGTVGDGAPLQTRLLDLMGRRP